MLKKNKLFIFLILFFVGHVHASDTEPGKKEVVKKIRVIRISKKDKGKEVAPVCKQEKKPYLRSYFSPGILEHLRTYVGHEREGILMAVYRLTHNDIAQDLIKKHNELKSRQTESPVRVIVEKQFTADWCIPLHSMIKAGILVKCNTSRYDDSNGFEIMHHKFIIFRKNKKNKELLVTGSFNITGQAEKNNWENIIITDDGDTIDKFFEQFRILNDNHSREITLKECHSPKDQQYNYSRKMNKIP